MPVLEYGVPRRRMGRRWVAVYPSRFMLSSGNFCVSGSSESDIVKPRFCSYRNHPVYGR
jgi:hypothetical protein